MSARLPRGRHRPSMSGASPVYNVKPTPVVALERVDLEVPPASSSACSGRLTSTYCYVANDDHGVSFNPGSSSAST